METLLDNISFTGEIDVACYNGEVKVNKSGHEYLKKITGAGCLLGSIVTACLTTEASGLDAAYEAVYFYGAPAQRAATHKEVGTGTFLPHFLN